MKRLTIKMDYTALYLMKEVCQSYWDELVKSQKAKTIEAGVILGLLIKFRQKCFFDQDTYRFKLYEYEAIALLDAIQFFWEDGLDPLFRSILSEYSTFLNKHL